MGVLFLEKLKPATLLDKRTSLQAFFEFFVYFSMDTYFGEFFFFFFFVDASKNSFKITKLLIQSILNCKWITACVTTTMSILNNKRTLIVCQLLLSKLAFGLFQVSRQDSGKMLSNMVLASLLSTWNIAITYMTDSIVYVFILSFLCFSFIVF